MGRRAGPVVSVGAPSRGGHYRIVLTRTESPTFDGISFGQVGRYEKLVGRAHGEVDPRDPRNAVIVDLALAPRNARGMVEYSTDVYILKPVREDRGNGKLLFELPNRGNIISNASSSPRTTIETRPRYWAF
jgi:hypothetical protein